MQQNEVLMDFGGIPSQILDIYVTERYVLNYGWATLTLRQVLEEIGEAVESADYTATPDGLHLVELLCWTKSWIIFYENSIPEHGYIRFFKRNPV
jgi:hypothetical protein